VSDARRARCQTPVCADRRRPSAPAAYEGIPKKVKTRSDFLSGSKKKSYFCKKILGMEIKKLDKRTSDKISFIAFIVPEFAAAFKIKALLIKYILLSLQKKKI
jgi:hypothetical protein